MKNSKFWIICVFFLLVGFLCSIVGYQEGYESGQVDAQDGKIKKKIISTGRRSSIVEVK